MTAPLLAAIFLLQVSITAGRLHPPEKVESSRGRPGAPPDRSVERVERAFQRSKLRDPALAYPDRYFWSDPADPSVTRYLYLGVGARTLPGVHVVMSGEQPRVFDGGCAVISGEVRPGGTPTFRCNNTY